MKFVSLGGINEHGRNSFYLEGESKRILLDCGLSEKNELPHFEKIEVPTIDYLFLSHSHLDHTGAIAELMKRGFKGKIVSSKETADCIHLESNNIFYPELLKETWVDSEISVTARRSGHCFGSLSFEIEMEKKKVIYTGDYLEDSVFQVDELRNLKADFAIVDGCYEKENGYQENKNRFLRLLKSRKGNVLLPLPKNGRNMDVISLLNQNHLPYRILGKGFFIENEETYMKSMIDIQQADNSRILLFTDSQLEDIHSRKIVNSYSDADIIFTGTIDEGSYADYVFKNRKNAFFSRINVHQTREEAYQLISQNHFSHSIIFHNRFTKEKEELEF